jgi:chromosome transmission fidelity protein 8
MIIPIHPAARLKEYCILEFQGEIVHEAGMTEGFTIGALSPHDAKKDTVCLQIGYHRLEGVKVPLKKPMVVLVREGQEDGPGASSQDESGFEAQAVIRCKFIFKTRPKALISHAY